MITYKSYEEIERIAHARAQDIDIRSLVRIKLGDRLRDQTENAGKAVVAKDYMDSFIAENQGRIKDPSLKLVCLDFYFYKPVDEEPLLFAVRNSKGRIVAADIDLEMLIERVNERTAPTWPLSNK